MMRSRHLYRTIVFLFLFCSSFSLLIAEPFRTSSLSTYEVLVTHSGEKPAVVTMGINDAVEISFPTDNPYLLGIEIEIRIPKIVASYRDSEVLYLYDSVTPSADGSPYDFEGTRLFKDLLPSRLSCVYRIPFPGKSFTERSPYAQELPVQLNAATGNLVLRTQLAMKGVPDAFLESLLEVSVNPVIADIGTLAVQVLYPEGTDLTALPLPLCYIDEVLTDISEPVLLKTGIHHLSVLSEQYRNEFRTFTIERAASSILQIPLKPVTTDITIQAPESAVLLLDGEPAESHRVLPVTAGEHLVTCKFADYEVTKSVTVVTGKSYIVTLAVDFSIFEQE